MPLQQLFLHDQCTWEGGEKKELFPDTIPMSNSSCDCCDATVKKSMIRVCDLKSFGVVRAQGLCLRCVLCRHS